MSSDGTVILAGDSWKRLYISTDSGATWAETQPKGDVNATWMTFMSADAGVLVAAESWGRVYKSTDLGASWDEVQPAGDESFNWSNVTLDPNGSIMIAMDGWSIMSRSTDGGSHWTAIVPPEIDAYWQTVCMSADGSRIILGEDDGRLWRSVDSGATWSEVRPAGDFDLDWQSSAMSHDGRLIVVGTDENRLYTSCDGGDTWFERLPVQAADRRCGALAITPDGRRVLAAWGAGYVLTAEPNPLPTLSPTIARWFDLTTPEAVGEVTDPGYSPVVSRGICWNTTGSPTLADSYVELGSGLGTFETQLPTATIGATYYIRSYAVNDEGTAYGAQASLTLSIEAPFWMQVQPKGDETARWTNGAVSGDGKVAVLMDSLSGKLYLSTDGGATWAPSEADFVFATEFMTAVYSQCSLSHDGMVMAMNGGSRTPKGPKRILGSPMYVSNDTGATWLTPPATTGVWAGVTVSSDGQILHALDLLEERLFTSVDAGLTWTYREFPRDYVVGFCASGDASLMALSLDYSDHPVRISNDGGQTWSDKAVSGEEEELYSIACSADGQSFYAPGESGLAVSHDGGETWSVIQPFGDEEVMSIRGAASANGQTVLLGGLGGLTLSRDGGTTWSRQLYALTDRANEDTGSGAWTVAGASADGKRFLAGKYDGDIYVGEIPEMQTVATGEPTSVSANAAECSGTVVAQSFLPITARGLCWNTTGSPTIGDAHTVDGSGSGAFVGTLTGLAPQTTYYVRAYAASILGVVYGEQRVVATSGTPDLFVNVLPGSGGSGSNGAFGVGDHAEFLIRIGNRGNAGANGITVTIPIPPGTRFVSAEPIIESSAQVARKDIVVSGDQVIITLPQLAPDEQVSIRLVLETLVAGQIALGAQLASAEMAAPVVAEQVVIEVHEEEIPPVQDDYYQIVSTGPLCGAAGAVPLLVAVFSLGLMRRRVRA
jgi:uncharacterized repeat protein (TIGR01451 family)